MASDHSDSNRNAVFTVGHSNHPINRFLELIARCSVTALADIRSAPYSRFTPQFNRENLAESLKRKGIEYVYLGDQLGGRTNDLSCYEEGRIRYDRLSQKQEFEVGLQRVIKGAKSYRIALMCAEKEPLSCHRTLLVGHKLAERGVQIAHILSDGSLEPHESAMNRLMARFDLLTDDDLFIRSKDRNELIAEAIAYQTERVGHVIETGVLGNQADS